MAEDVRMPQFTELMEEGTIVRWLKSAGDAIALGDPLVEIDTDKASLTYESDIEGVLLGITAREGEVVRVGSVIAYIGSSSEWDAQSTTSPRQPQALGRDGRRVSIDASLLVRRLAESHGIDLMAIKGSGPGGRIVRADIEARVEELRGHPGPPPEATREMRRGTPEVIALNQAQEVMAKRMAEVKTTVPHFYLTVEVDMTPALKTRAQLQDGANGGKVRPSVNDLILKASALALREHPRVNSSFVDGGLHQYSRVNIGVAIATEHCVVVSPVLDADRMDLNAIAERTRELSRRVAEGRITPEELTGSTFTVSNLGMYGVDTVAAVLNPPEAAILGVGKIRRAPAVNAASEIVVADVITLTISCDHRVLSGTTCWSTRQHCSGRTADAVRSLASQCPNSSLRVSCQTTPCVGVARDRPSRHQTHRLRGPGQEAIRASLPGSPSRRAIASPRTQLLRPLLRRAAPVPPAPQQTPQPTRSR
jgi:pyruvate dehydrogenase E2 component (dihydrolipoamide acetyltransferase)